MTGGTEQWRTLIDELAKAGDEDFNLGRLPEEERASLVVDLSDLAEASERLWQSFSKVLRETASAGVLEDVLVEFEVELAHLRWHWESLVSTLRAHDLWMEDDVRLRHE